MSKKDNGGAAFPSQNSSGEFGDDMNKPGMTLRDYFAAKAMSAIIALNDVEYENMRHVAADAYRYADFMIEAQKK